MDRLFRGVLRFQAEDFAPQRELFARLGRRQRPHTLFVGCSDSRVVPTLITGSAPGELFKIRNVANIVPPHGSRGGDGTAASLEYAVQVLGVGRIVVCGHSNCGGCAALNLPAGELEGLPLTRRWLAHSAQVPGRVDRLLSEGASPVGDREWLTEQLNVVVQLANLRTYPFVAERIASGALVVQGWYYVIGSGEVFVYDDGRGRFERLAE